MKANDVIKTAAYNIGYKEKAGNDNKFGVIYGWNNVPWCVIFAWYCYFKNDISIYKTASTSEMLRYGIENKLKVVKPRPADIVIYDGHTGLFEKPINSTYFYAIEGNAGNSVKRVKRKYKEVIAFLRFIKEDYTLTLPEVTLKRGAKGYEVKLLQRFLNWWTSSNTIPLVIDGSFGPLTEARVKAFQLTSGLDDDGSVGPLTREEMKRWK